MFRPTKNWKGNQSDIGSLYMKWWLLAAAWFFCFFHSLLLERELKSWEMKGLVVEHCWSLDDHKKPCQGVSHHTPRGMKSRFKYYRGKWMSIFLIDLLGTHDSSGFILWCSWLFRLFNSVTILFFFFLCVTRNALQKRGETLLIQLFLMVAIIILITLVWHFPRLDKNLISSFFLQLVRHDIYLMLPS